MDKLLELLNRFVRTPNDAELNYSIAIEYEGIGQTAAAISYFLRAAERTEDKKLAYECLCKIGLCFDRQGGRDNSTRGAYKHAICLIPTRPEAYFLLARHYERRGDHVLGYMFAEQGLEFTKDTDSLRSNVEYPGRYGLVFQKAVSAWWWGKPDESRRLLLDVWNNYNLDTTHLAAVEKNLQTLNIPYKKPSVVINIGPKQESMDIVLQGTYSSDTDEIIESYLKLPFVNRIILSCWENDAPFSAFSSRVKRVRSRAPSSPGTDNRNMQIISSRTGLQFVETPLVAKMRTDQLYTPESMQLMWEYMDQCKDNRIHVAGMYPNLLFHPRDHIFWGRTESVIKLFSCPLEINGFADRVRVDKNNLWQYYHLFVRSETYIGAHYASLFNPHIVEFLAKPEEYLYDVAPKWNEAYSVSSSTTPKLFKSFPREGIDLKWKRKGWDHYPYDEQYATGERWTN